MVGKSSIFQNARFDSKNMQKLKRDHLFNIIENIQINVVKGNISTHRPVIKESVTTTVVLFVKCLQMKRENQL